MKCQFTFVSIGLSYIKAIILQVQCKCQYLVPVIYLRCKICFYDFFRVMLLKDNFAISKK